MTSRNRSVYALLKLHRSIPSIIRQDGLINEVIVRDGLLELVVFASDHVVQMFLSNTT